MLFFLGKTKSRMLFQRWKPTGLQKKQKQAKARSVTIGHVAFDSFSTELAALSLCFSSPNHQCSLRNDGTVTTRVLYIQLSMTTFTSVPYEIIYKFKHVAQRRTTAASRDTDQRNPSMFTWINARATLKKHQQNCAEHILQSIPFCLHCRDLSGKNAINEHGSASFYLRNPWIKWFTFIHSLVKWGVGTNPL